jgi:hypothetical protein
VCVRGEGKVAQIVLGAEKRRTTSGVIWVPFLGSQKKERRKDDLPIKGWRTHLAKRAANAASSTSGLLPYQGKGQRQSRDATPAPLNNNLPPTSPRVQKLRPRCQISKKG